MEPIKIQVEVSLSGETLDVLRQFAPDMPQDVYDGTRQDLKTMVQSIVVDFLKSLKKEAKKPVAETEAETEQPAAAEENHAPAAPEASAVPETKPVSDGDLRQAVKAAKDRTSAKAVREVFATFGIEASVECPQDRRPDLMAALANLK